MRILLSLTYLKEL